MAPWYKTGCYFAQSGEYFGKHGPRGWGTEGICTTMAWGGASPPTHLSTKPWDVCCWLLPLVGFQAQPVCSLHWILPTSPKQSPLNLVPSFPLKTQPPSHRQPKHPPTPSNETVVEDDADFESENSVRSLPLLISTPKQSIPGRETLLYYPTRAGRAGGQGEGGMLPSPHPFPPSPPPPCSPMVPLPPPPPCLNKPRV